MFTEEGAFHLAKALFLISSAGHRVKYPLSGLIGAKRKNEIKEREGNEHLATTWSVQVSVQALPIYVRQGSCQLSHGLQAKVDFSLFK